MSFLKWWQQPGSPGPAGLLQGGCDSSMRAGAGRAVAGLAQELAASPWFCRVLSEEGDFAAAHKGSVSPVFDL